MRAASALNSGPAIACDGSDGFTCSNACPLAHKNVAILCVAKNELYQDAERTKKAFDHFQRYFDLGGKDDELKKLYETIRSVLHPGR